MLDALKAAWELIAGRPDVDIVERWADDETAFEEHFGQSYDTFSSLVEELDKAHFDLYKKTLEVNPEAAVTWVFFIGSGE